MISERWKADKVNPTIAPGHSLKEIQGHGSRKGNPGRASQSNYPEFKRQSWTSCKTKINRLCKAEKAAQREKSADLQSPPQEFSRVHISTCLWGNFSKVGYALTLDSWYGDWCEQGRHPKEQLFSPNLVQLWWAVFTAELPASLAVAHCWDHYKCLLPLCSILPPPPSFHKYWSLINICTSNIVISAYASREYSLWQVQWWFQMTSSLNLVFGKLCGWWCNLLGRINFEKKKVVCMTVWGGHRVWLCYVWNAY